MIVFVEVGSRCGCEVELIVEQDSLAKLVKWSYCGEIFIVHFAPGGWIDTYEVAPFPLKFGQRFLEDFFKSQLGHPLHNGYMRGELGVLIGCLLY